MNLVALGDRVLPERWRGLTAESVKFGLIGIANMVINFAVFNLLVLTVLPKGEIKASTIATVVATTCSYFMNRHWTYGDRPRSAVWREYSLFFLFNLGGLIIEQGVLLLGKYGLGITSLIALNAVKFLGIGMGTVFRFWAYRTHVFRKAPAEVSVDAAILPHEIARTPGAPGAFLLDEVDGVDAELIDVELDGLVAEAERRRLDAAPPR